MKKLKKKNPGSKNESRNNKEITNGDKSGNRKPRKDIRKHRFKHHQQNIRVRQENLRSRRYHRKHWHNSQRKCKKLLTQNIQEIKDTMRRSNLKIVGIEESKDSHLKGPVNIFNKIIEENSPNVKKEMLMNIQEAYRTPNRLNQKRNSPVT